MKLCLTSTTLSTLLVLDCLLLMSSMLVLAVALVLHILSRCEGYLRHADEKHKEA